MAQVTAVEDLVAKNVDILLVAANQADTLMNALTTAADKGIKIVIVDTDAPDFRAFHHSSASNERRTSA